MWIILTNEKCIILSFSRKIKFNTRNLKRKGKRFNKVMEGKPGWSWMMKWLFFFIFFSSVSGTQSRSLCVCFSLQLEPWDCRTHGLFPVDLIFFFFWAIFPVDWGVEHFISNDHCRTHGKSCYLYKWLVQQLSLDI